MRLYGLRRAMHTVNYYLKIMYYKPILGVEECATFVEKHKESSSSDIDEVNECEVNVVALLHLIQVGYNCSRLNANFSIMRHSYISSEY
uniref:Uncharacterized protein n=1 Tax=Lactuca sativa TaxID=4236 RepID=A0A9R1X0U1_LACSA|nr:hypothetical protein LSAT_V11C800448580 [Lactuca sativa]